MFEFAASVFGGAAAAPRNFSSAADRQAECQAGDRSRDRCCEHHQPQQEPSTSSLDQQEQQQEQQQQGCGSWQHFASSASASSSASSSSSHSPMLSALLAGLLLTSASTFPRGALADDGGGWTDGRATYYGNDGGECASGVLNGLPDSSWLDGYAHGQMGGHAYNEREWRSQAGGVLFLSATAGLQPPPALGILLSPDPHRLASPATPTSNTLAPLVFTTHLCALTNPTSFPRRRPPLPVCPGATIDQGSCMYGSLPNGLVSTGTDIAAIADANPSFAGSCG